MKALTLTQRWAGLVASGIKLVENRPRAMGAQKMIGERIAIHASREIDVRVYDRIAELAPELATRVTGDGEPTWAFDVTQRWYQLSQHTSAIIGVATIDKVLDPRACNIDPTDPDALAPIPADQRRWFFGPVGILLRDVRSIEPITGVKGALGFWTVTSPNAARIEEQLR